MLMRNILETSNEGGLSYRDEVFNALYEANYSSICRYVHYKVADFHDAEDLVSRVFEKAIKKLHYYNSEKGTPSAWLFSITRNTIIDYYRGLMNCKTVPSEIIEELAFTIENLDDLIISNEMKKQLIRALNVLNERERELIRLKYWEDMSNRGIANLVGISESNAGVILFRGVKKLRKALDKEEKKHL